MRVPDPLDPLQRLSCGQTMEEVVQALETEGVGEVLELREAARKEYRSLADEALRLRQELVRLAARRQEASDCEEQEVCERISVVRRRLDEVQRRVDELEAELQRWREADARWEKEVERRRRKEMGKYRVRVYDSTGKAVARVRYNQNLDVWMGLGVGYAGGGRGRHKGLARLADGRYVLIYGTDREGERDYGKIISPEEALREILRSGKTWLLKGKRFRELRELNVEEFYEELYGEILQIREKAMAMETEELIRRAEESGMCGPFVENNPRSAFIRAMVGMGVPVRWDCLYDGRFEYEDVARMVGRIAPEGAGICDYPESCPRYLRGRCPEKPWPMYFVLWHCEGDVLKDGLDLRLEEILREEEEKKKRAAIYELLVKPDHVCVLMHARPELGIHRLVGLMKSRSSRLLRQEFPWLRLRLPNLWARGSLCVLWDNFLRSLWAREPSDFMSVTERISRAINEGQQCRLFMEAVEELIEEYRSAVARDRKGGRRPT